MLVAIGRSSRSTIISSLRDVTLTGTISPLNQPFSIAAMARAWLMHASLS
ncbi:MAG: hypothetical protein ACD_75C01507G0001 [uncultured bacterium]|nr:MAG: hypothetical protein ACD_75C01507G0001 [uncultured bacterium]